MDIETLAARSRSLASQVQGLPNARMLAFLVACAARTAPLFRLFRATSPASSVEDAVDEMWAAVLGADYDAIPGIFERLTALPEVGDPDSEVRDYIALQAIAACYGPVGALGSPRPAEEIFKAITHVGDVARELDSALGYEDLTGPLLALETTAAQECYRLLVKDQTASVPIDDLKGLCRPVMDAYIQAAPQVAANRGWQLAD